MIAAIIVTYFPKWQAVHNLILGLESQVQKIFVVDNTPSHSTEFISTKEMSNYGSTLELIVMGENAGIAAAQNEAIGKALKEGFEDVIFFDQDSRVSSDLIARLKSCQLYLNQQELAVGAIGPAFQDEKTQELAAAIAHNGLRVQKIAMDTSSQLPIACDYLISSGSLVSTQTIRVVGDMRADLFIDWVDIEWGLRAKTMGYQCFMLPTVVMQHSIGDQFVDFFGRKINLHSDFRNFFIVRNAVYLALHSQLDWRWRINALIKTPLYVLFYSWHTFSDSRWSALKLLSKGVWRGLTGKLGKF